MYTTVLHKMQKVFASDFLLRYQILRHTRDEEVPFLNSRDNFKAKKCLCTVIFVYRCVAFDTRGYGESSKPAHISDYTLDQIVEDIDHLITYFGKQTSQNDAKYYK